MRSTRYLAQFAALCVLACTNESPSEPPEAEPDPEAAAMQQGFTQPPPRDAEWLPPPPPPFLEEVPARKAGPEERREANEKLASLLAGYERGQLGAGRLADEARRYARAGAVDYMKAEELQRAYAYPNDASRADALYQGRVITLTGWVAPKSMTDAADGFKVFELEPYVHEPVLLMTDFEHVFVRCHLARAEEQPLRDWQTIHLLGVVEGKKRGDVVLQRCVVL